MQESPLCLEHAKAIESLKKDAEQSEKERQLLINTVLGKNGTPGMDEMVRSIHAWMLTQIETQKQRRKTAWDTFIKPLVQALIVGGLTYLGLKG
jgi:hypothetical protein